MLLASCTRTVPSAKRFYYTDEGIEIDVYYVCDQPYDVIRYLYISNSSAIKLPNGVGIRSTREDVLKEYEAFIIEDFAPLLTSEEVIALGSDFNGIYFVIRDDYVYSIYVGTVGEFGKSSWLFTPTVSTIMYPARFYPDREYMESTQS